MIGSRVFVFFFSSRRRHTRCALVTGVQTCALPIFAKLRRGRGDPDSPFASTPLNSLVALLIAMMVGGLAHGLPRWCRPTRTSAMAIDNVTFGIQEQALQVQRRRLELIAANIANADTPGFQARDIDFRKVLESAQKSATSPGAMTQTLSSATPQ